MEGNSDIAVIVLTYNESLHLGRALEHVKGFARQIFVVDSYSTDDTVDIARAYGATVFQHLFQNHAKQLQWALENSPISSEWVMRLDADEVVEPELSAEIVARLPNLPADVTGVYLNCKTVFQGRFIRHGGRYPLKLMRIWRHGKARILDRWMDERVYLTGGRSVNFRGAFANDNLMDVTFFIDKHNKYASKEALDIVNRRLSLWQLESASAFSGEPGVQRTGLKRFVKEKVYTRIPFQISALAYFLYRYIVRLGFLDGSEGLAYHVLQGFWYRFLVGVKVREIERAVRKTSTADEARSEILRLTHQRIG